ncbi:LysM peptidoglycan-binding domain-containing protein [Methylocucumis oryzae]|uniref:Peptidoglycan-binding protein n=1 Tax=Methylocucumis oryzae TaxID=1632867 RepID=A0A0F3IN69_9GAMM|nr:LysM domain-containing protein [Methylocucumis oryzae]KJV07004.1 peptidoglycan-binding protein [Methylocucumis oryzae]
MAFRTFFAWLCLFCFSLTLNAEEIQINPNHPEQYTVVKGDTLWDISGKFLTHPWQWPELWSYNSQIKNPHLIYPGDTVYFSIVNGKPQLSLTRAPVEFTVPKDGPCILHEAELTNGRTSFPEDGKLKPCIREMDLQQAIKVIPMDKIAQFLSSPRVVDPRELAASPYIVSVAGEHVIAGVGDKIYVRSILSARNPAFTVYRGGDTFVSPETGEILGYEAEYIADATLMKPGDPATMLIKKSASELRLGDKVMPKLEEEITLNYFPKAPDKKINARIISVLDGVSQIGTNNIVVLDKGLRDGLRIGHVLEVYQDGKAIVDIYSKTTNEVVKLPNELAGAVMVFRPFERVSYALVMKASQAIHVLDRVQTP